MKDKTGSKISQPDVSRIFWSRRLKNHWVSHSQDVFHLLLGVFFLGLFAVGTLIQSSCGTEPAPLSRLLQRAGFCGLFLVLLLTFLHMNLHGTDRFLHHFRDTGNLPAGQMHQVSSLCMVLFLTAAVIFMAGAAAAMPLFGALIASLFSGRSAASSPEAEILPFPDAPVDTPDLSTLAVQAGEPPSWLPILESVMTFVAMLTAAALVCILLYRLVRRLCSFLLRDREWDDDEKTFLKPTLLSLTPPEDQPLSGSQRSILPFSRPSSYRDAIRREYRRAIHHGLKANKGTARPGDSPAELEAAAGGCDPILHQIYEKARYAPGSRTREDLNAVRTGSNHVFRNHHRKKPQPEMPAAADKIQTHDKKHRL